LTRSGAINIFGTGTFDAPLLRTLDGSLTMSSAITSVNLPSLKTITAASVTISGSSFAVFDAPVLETVQIMTITAPLVNASFPSLQNGTSLIFGIQPTIHLPSLKFISNRLSVTSFTTSVNLDSLKTVSGLFEIFTSPVALPSLLSIFGGLGTKGTFNAPLLTIIGQTWTIQSPQTSIDAPSLIRLGGLVIPLTVASINLPLLTYIEGGMSSTELNISNFTLPRLERIDGFMNIIIGFGVDTLFNFTELRQSSDILIACSFSLPCTVEFPRLSTVNGYIIINNYEELGSSVNSLQTVASLIELACTNCASIDLPLLVSVGSDLSLQGNSLASNFLI
jgi:hypothetical protein